MSSDYEGIWLRYYAAQNGNYFVLGNSKILAEPFIQSRGGELSDSLAFADIKGEEARRIIEQAQQEYRFSQGGSNWAVLVTEKKEIGKIDELYQRVQSALQTEFEKRPLVLRQGKG